MRCINNNYACQTFFNIQQSFDGKEYICKKCHSKVVKGELPCQAVVNNMYVDETPTQLASLEKLEQELIDSQFSILWSYSVFFFCFFLRLFFSLTSQ